MKNLAILVLIGLASMARGADWPRETQSELGLITIYQPQLGSYTGDSLRARAAISITQGDTTEPVFGAVWLSCRVATDRPNRTVKLEDVSVRRIRFPNGTDQDTARIADVLEEEIPRWELTFSLDELLESLANVEKERDNARGLEVTPPKIILRNHPAVLVLIDGDPEITGVEGTSLKRVVNTPYFLAQEPTTGVFYLKGGSLWYSAVRVMGPWKHIETAPARVGALADQMNSDEEAAGDTEEDIPSTTGVIPEIVVSTEPAELIATDGPPAFAPINGTGLLYVTNTPGRLFLEIATQHYYLLASGRWYSATALAGPWTYVASNQLPADFANIPPGSECDDVLANVSGTLPAKEAIMDAQIPQTAEVDRSGTTSDVQYDGDPQFDPIEGTSMSYAVNSSTPVILLGDRYYDCDQGVWFEGMSPNGPWVVSTRVPPELYTIPPRYPVYYVRYVRVYGYTPAVVYMGYTSGYTGCYVYNGTVVYGTGFHYRPWYRRRYYARPWTWGFGIHYDPWAGWSMGHSHGWWRPRGWFAYHSGRERPGWWGPAGYRPLYRPTAGPVYRRGYHPVYRPVHWTAATPPPSTGGRRNAGSTRGGTLYDQWPSGVRRPTVRPLPPPAPMTVAPAPRTEDPTGQRRTERPQVNKGVQRDEVLTPKPAGQPAREPDVPRTGNTIDRTVRQREVIKEPPPVPRPIEKANNVFVDPNGTILRKTQQNWEIRTQNTWKDAGAQPANGDVEREAQVRQRSAERASSFKAPPPPAPPPQPRPAVAPAPKPQPQPQPVQPSKPPDKKKR